MEKQDKESVMSKTKIRGLSQREVEIMAWLEFYQKYFFKSKEIKQFFSNKNC